MTADHPEERGRVPVSDLRELVKEWREYTEPMDRETQGWYYCAIQLEELVAEYE